MNKNLFLTQYKECISSEIQCMPEELCILIDSYIPKKVLIPTDIVGLEHYTFHCKDNIIYIIGGIKDSQVRNTIYIWDIQYNILKKSTLLYSLWLHKSIMIDDDIYIFGGETIQKRVTSTIQKFNIYTLNCVYYSNMIHPRCSFSIEKYANTIYCIGGDSGYREYGVLSSVEKIHIPTKNRKLCNSMNSSCFFHSSCLKNNCIYVFGGIDSEDEHFIPSVRIYNIIKDIWSKYTILSKSISHKLTFAEKILKYSSIEHSSIIYKDTILLYGGYNNFMNRNEDIYKFDKNTISLYKKNIYPIISIMKFDNTYYKITKEDNYLVFSIFD